MDETTPQTTANTQRMWSYIKPRKKVNTTKMRANTFGFYTLDGKCVVDIKKDSKQESVCEFLDLIKQNNSGKKIIIIIDNFRSHYARVVREKMNDLDITMVYLPPYSPDLNPIEFIWKDIKKEISSVFIEKKDQLHEIIISNFNGLSKKVSYAKKWCKYFLPKQKYSLLGI